MVFIKLRVIGKIFSKCKGFEKSQFYKFNKELWCKNEEINCLKEGGMAAEARESIQRDTTTLATATDSEVKESDHFADVEEDKHELEENELVYWRTATLLYYALL